MRNIGILKLDDLWVDFFIGAGLIGIFTLLGYYSHQFALLQANLFGDWGAFFS